MQQDHQSKTFHSAHELRELTGLSLPTVYNWINSQGFPCIRVGRRVLIPVDAFHRWLEEQARSKEL